MDSPAGKLVGECDQFCGKERVPYPFGFSDECTIKLNCSSNSGNILIGDFLVQNVTSDQIFISLPQKCNRPIEKLSGLFGPNFAPTWRNDLLLHNCSSPLIDECLIPSRLVRSEICDDYYNGSCYPTRELDKPEFLDYGRAMSNGDCSILFSSIIVNLNETGNSSFAVEYQTMEVGWWVEGECDCDSNANCTPVVYGGQQQGFRCKCNEGYAGDGFTGGEPCRRVVVICLVCASGIIILSIPIFCYLKRRRSRRGYNQNVEKFLLQNGDLAPKRYKYSEIKTITKSFKDKLGQGGYGNVYKGKLPDDRDVAVKVLIETDSNGEEFINEVASISRTSHVNIVNLLGFCYDKKRALVYEFMPNKSLDNFISNSSNDCHIDGEKMYKISVGVAKGLEYLHTGCNTRIVHFDIKPQNILLDADMCPKISDFGLAKLCKKKQSILSVVGTRGTIGYIAPEVFSRNFGGVSHKSDVYSYGMMVLEMAGARRIVGTDQEIQSSENYFPDKLYEHVIMGITNKGINNLMVEEEEEEDAERKMFKVGFWCIQTNPSDRPSMSKVVEMLEGSLKSIKIPPKPILFAPPVFGLEFSSSLSMYVETENLDEIGSVAVQRRREHAVAVGKERREALMRTKRFCRVGVSSDNADVLVDDDMMTDEEQSVLVDQTVKAVEELKHAIAYQGKGAIQKRVNALRELRRLLSKSEYPPVEAVLEAGAMPTLVQCLLFGLPDEQLLEAAWCLTNIAAGKPEETKALLPALPLLIAHIGEKSSLPVAEQCAWALGNVAGEGEELRNTLLSQGALPPLARMMLPNKGSTVRTAAWALSNLIKGPDPKAATELIRIDGVLDAILRHLKRADEELATEVAWVVVYLTALSNVATSLLAKSDLLQILVDRLASSNSLQLLIPVLRSLGNIVAGDSYVTNNILVSGINAIQALTKCLKSEHRVLKKESAWVLSNIAAGSIEHKKLIHASEAASLLTCLLSTAPFDIKKEVAYVLGNLCVAPAEGSGRPNLIVEHLVSLVGGGCLGGFVDLVRSADIEAARLGLQFMELVLRGMPNGEGPKLVEAEDGIDAMERFQFHENEDLRNMANELVDKYFGEDYGLDS
ncbi:hypothetical protein BUALT_Bualt11G0112100 [Buddleja alternifolia]|uniref:Protein kinase domain-containing protein n=1 Tax=Buddleja alternifolia TaxID=168488 RepID=A0AAV6WVK1_9LAMI|nr:hypothetical protein BUALT_Bualt11G0112100 [Buddleja alternifolia]